MKLHRLAGKGLRLPGQVGQAILANLDLQRVRDVRAGVVFLPSHADKDRSMTQKIRVCLRFIRQTLILAIRALPVLFFARDLPQAMAVADRGGWWPPT